MTVLGSGSSGNCYILESENEMLIIELGVSFKDILQVLDSKKKVVGALVTHEHWDHAKSVKNAVEHGIKVYMTPGTASTVLDDDHYLCNKVEYRKEYSVGNFKIIPFETEHDVVEPCGFVIKHKEMGTLLFATDTYYIKYNFKGINHWMIECNYSKEILEMNIGANSINNRQASRVIKSHFELGNVKEFFKTKNLNHTKNIVLIHLSETNSNAKQFKEEIQCLTHKNTYIAQKGLIVDFTLCPF